MLYDMNSSSEFRSVCALRGPEKGGDIVAMRFVAEIDGPAGAGKQWRRRVDGGPIGVDVCVDDSLVLRAAV